MTIKTLYYPTDAQIYIRRIRDQIDVTTFEVLFHFFYAQRVSDINTSSSGASDFFIVSSHCRASVCHTDTTPTSHTETPTHIETRTHNQCGDTIKKSQAPDDGCINVRNMLIVEEVK